METGWFACHNDDEKRGKGGDEKRWRERGRLTTEKLERKACEERSEWGQDGWMESRKNGVYGYRKKGFCIYMSGGNGEILMLLCEGSAVN